MAVFVPPHVIFKGKQQSQGQVINSQIYKYFLHWYVLGSAGK